LTPARPESRLVYFAEGLREEAARERPPGKVGIAQALDGLGLGVELLDSRYQGRSPLRRVEVAGQLEHGRVLERWLPADVTAGGEDEEGPAECRVPLLVVERHFLPCDEGEDDQIDVDQAVCSSAMERASSRIAIPSSISSRVIVSGGHTMITFQCVIR
jgi:hypothetical protein